MSAIRTVELSKTYSSPEGKVPAVEGLTLEVASGEFFGLLGPNGAGKSTTVGMLTTLVRPSAGRAEVAGIDVSHRPVQVRRNIGVASQADSLDRKLSVADNLEFRGRFLGMTRRVARRRAEALLETFSLVERRNARAHELSGGQVKRLIIARALMHRPQVLFLDEPTAGIDPQTRHNLWDALRALHADGQTILLTTHHMDEAEALCQRAAIIDNGRLLACDTVPTLLTLAGAKTIVTVTYDRSVPSDLEGLRGHPDVSRVDVNGSQVKAHTHDAESLLGDLITAGVNAGLRVRHVMTLRPSLESVFLTLTGREYRE
ncbi:MAG: ATP-binding cassette domain-containing protein [Streptosporangiales bacterium]|nr:ATP-binding cassette domain-containing protein [Streptosporangiales bacterium]